MIDIASFNSLLSHVVDNRGKTCPESDAGIPLIATNCVKNETLFPTFDKVRYVSPETYKTWFRGHPLPGDMIFVLKGAPGQVCLTPDPVSFCIAQDMVAIRANPQKVYPPYLFAVLRSSLIQNEIGNMHVGTMIPHFKKGDFDKLRIPLPVQNIQEYIGDSYLEFSRKIDLNRRMNETLEAMARAVFKDWFIDFGPTRAKMEGSPPYLAPEIWSLFPDHLDADGKPEGWQVGTLDDIAQQVGESVSPEKLSPETPYIGLEHMPRRSIALDAWEGAGKVTSGKMAFKRGDLLFGKLRPYFHKVGIAPIDGICSTDIVVLNAKMPNARSFIISCISQDDFVAFTDRTSDGTKMPRTSWGRMAKYNIFIPAPQIFAAFDVMASSLFDRLIANIHESQTLAATRDLLLPKLMSGEIRVRDAEKLVEDVV